MTGGKQKRSSRNARSKRLLCVVVDILFCHLWYYINCLWLVEASAVVKIEPNCLTPEQSTPNLPFAPLGSGRNKQKSSSSSLFVCISFPPRKKALLKYSATSKWCVTLTRLFSLMSSSSNPSMIHLLRMGFPSE